MKAVLTVILNHDALGFDVNVVHPVGTIDNDMIDGLITNGVDVFLTNSRFVARRIQKIYRRPSTPVYPPVDVENFTLHEKKDDFYLTASRMVP